jgi:hypothetical protein
MSSELKQKAGCFALSLCLYAAHIHCDQCRFVWKFFSQLHFSFIRKCSIQRDNVRLNSILSIPFDFNCYCRCFTAKFVNLINWQNEKEIFFRGLTKMSSDPKNWNSAISISHLSSFMCLNYFINLKKLLLRNKCQRKIKKKQKFN